jgi:hypothetical protein
LFRAFVLALITLLGLVLAGLAALLALAGLTTLTLSRLSRLSALLVLSDLIALLTFLLHVICHKSFPPEKARVFPRFRNLIAFHNLVAARDCKGWERILPQLCS